MIFLIPSILKMNKKTILRWIIAFIMFSLIILIPYSIFVSIISDYQDSRYINYYDGDPHFDLLYNGYFSHSIVFSEALSILNEVTYEVSHQYNLDPFPVLWDNIDVVFQKSNNSYFSEILIMDDITYREVIGYSSVQENGVPLPKIYIISHLIDQSDITSNSTLIFPIIESDPLHSNYSLNPKLNFSSAEIAYSGSFSQLFSSSQYIRQLYHSSIEMTIIVPISSVSTITIPHSFSYQIGFSINWNKISWYEKWNPENIFLEVREHLHQEFERLNVIFDWNRIFEDQPVYTKFNEIRAFQYTLLVVFLLLFLPFFVLSTSSISLIRRIILSEMADSLRVFDLHSFSENNLKINIFITFFGSSVISVILANSIFLLLNPLNTEIDDIFLSLNFIIFAVLLYYSLSIVMQVIRNNKDMQDQIPLSNENEKKTNINFLLVGIALSFLSYLILFTGIVNNKVLIVFISSFFGLILMFLGLNNFVEKLQGMLINFSIKNNKKKLFLFTKKIRYHHKFGKSNLVFAVIFILYLMILLIVPPSLVSLSNQEAIWVNGGPTTITSSEPLNVTQINHLKNSLGIETIISQYMIELYNSETSDLKFNVENLVVLGHDRYSLETIFDQFDIIDKHLPNFDFKHWDNSSNGIPNPNLYRNAISGNFTIQVIDDQNSATTDLTLYSSIENWPGLPYPLERLGMKMDFVVVPISWFDSFLHQHIVPGSSQIKYRYTIFDSSVNLTKLFETTQELPYDISIKSVASENSTKEFDLITTNFWVLTVVVFLFSLYSFSHFIIQSIKDRRRIYTNYGLSIGDLETLAYAELIFPFLLGTIIGIFIFILTILSLILVVFQLLFRELVIYSNLSNILIEGNLELIGLFVIINALWILFLVKLGFRSWSESQDFDFVLR